MAPTWTHGEAMIRLTWWSVLLRRRLGQVRRAAALSALPLVDY
jgi:hypothetical protein